MATTSNPYTALVERARAGDAPAAASLPNELADGLVHALRQLLRTGGGDSPLDHYLLRQCKRFDPHCQDEQALAERLARHMSKKALARPGETPARQAALRDTVRQL